MNLSGIAYSLSSLVETFAAAVDEDPAVVWIAGVMWAVIVVVAVAWMVRQAIRKRRKPNEIGASQTAPGDGAATNFEGQSQEMLRRYNSMPPHIATQQRKDKRRATQWVVALGIIAAAVFVVRACVRAELNVRNTRSAQAGTNELPH
jgi:hypothetical protein